MVCSSTIKDSNNFSTGLQCRRGGFTEDTLANICVKLVVIIVSANPHRQAVSRHPLEDPFILLDFVAASQ